MFNGKLIYYLRRQRGLSQNDLATEFEVTRGTISNWEIGRRTPSVKQFIDIADFFGVSLDLFVTHSMASLRREILIQLDAFFSDPDITEKEKERLYDAIKNLYFEKNKK